MVVVVIVLNFIKWFFFNNLETKKRWKIFFNSFFKKKYFLKFKSRKKNIFSDLETKKLLSIKYRVENNILSYQQLHVNHYIIIFNKVQILNNYYIFGLLFFPKRDLSFRFQPKERKKSQVLGKVVLVFVYAQAIHPLLKIKNKKLLKLYSSCLMYLFLFLFSLRIIAWCISWAHPQEIVW